MVQDIIMEKRLRNIGYSQFVWTMCRNKEVTDPTYIRLDGNVKAFPGTQPFCKLRKHWRSLSHQRVVPPKQRSRSCPERCNMRRLENCDEQLVEPESGWDGVSAFQGRCVTLPPL